jgi:hypothetical protein
MATALTLLNNTLTGLRRDRLTTVSSTDAYHLLLLQFLNRGKQLAEQAWDWEALRTTVTVTLSASTYVYELSSGAAADTDVTRKSRLLYEQSRRYERNESSVHNSGDMPQVFDVTDSDEHRLDEVSWEQLERMRFTDDDNTDTKPTCFALRKKADYHELAVYPAPTGARTLKMRFVIPQADIPNLFMTSYTLSVPAEPVWTYAVWRAAKERGENVSRPLDELELDHTDALYLAMTEEMGMDDFTVNPV